MSSTGHIRLLNAHSGSHRWRCYTSGCTRVNNRLDSNPIWVNLLLSNARASSTEATVELGETLFLSEERGKAWSIVLRAPGSARIGICPRSIIPEGVSDGTRSTVPESIPNGVHGFTSVPSLRGHNHDFLFSWGRPSLVVFLREGTLRCPARKKSVRGI